MEIETLHGDPGTMVLGTRDFSPYGPKDQGPLAKNRLGPGTIAERSPGTRDHSENLYIFHYADIPWNNRRIQRIKHYQGNQKNDLYSLSYPNMTQ